MRELLGLREACWASAKTTRLARSCLRSSSSFSPVSPGSPGSCRSFGIGATLGGSAEHREQPRQVKPPSALRVPCEAPVRQAQLCWPEGTCPRATRDEHFHPLRLTGSQASPKSQRSERKRTTRNSSSMNPAPYYPDCVYCTTPQARGAQSHRIGTYGDSRKPAIRAYCLPPGSQVWDGRGGRCHWNHVRGW